MGPDGPMVEGGQRGTVGHGSRNGGSNMKVENGKIVEATENELFGLYLIWKQIWED